MAFGVSRKPSALHPLFLFEEFFDSPECGEGKYPEKRTYYHVLDKKSRAQSGKSREEINPPRTCAEIILGFYDDRVAHTDYEECEHSYEQSFEVHLRGLLSLVVNPILWSAVCQCFVQAK